MFSMATACVQASVMILAIVALRALFYRTVPPFVFVVCWWFVFLRGLLPFFPPVAHETVDAHACAVSHAVAVGFSGESVVPFAGAQVSHTGQTLVLDADVLSIVFTAGAALCLFVAAVAYGATRLRLSRATPVPSCGASAAFNGMPLPPRRFLRVLELDDLSTPVSYGVFRPTVVLPKGFDASVTHEQLHLVIRHEISHLRRFDVVAKPLAALVVCIYWFNPLVWFAFWAMAADMERTSDAWALRNCRKAERAMYARTLLNAKTIRGTSTLGFGTRPIESRIAAILAPKPKLLACIMSCILVLTCCFGSFAFASAAFPVQTDGLVVTVRNGGYSFDIPEYWQGRVSVQADGDSTYVFPTGYPDLPLVTFEVIPMGTAIEDNAANPVLFTSEYGDGGCLVVRGINYLWMTCGDLWRTACAANPSYPGIEGERLVVDLSTGGAYDADDARLLVGVYAGQEDEAPAGGDSVAKRLVSSIVVKFEGSTVYGPVLPE